MTCHRTCRPSPLQRPQETAVGELNCYLYFSPHVERHNWTIRILMKRFTRLSLGFSKKLDNLAAAVAVYVAYFNSC